MTKEERDRCLSLRKKAKTGQHITPEEEQFLIDMWEQYPDDYHKIDEEIMEWSRNYKNWI